MQFLGIRAKLEFHDSLEIAYNYLELKILSNQEMLPSLAKYLRPFLNLTNITCFRIVCAVSMNFWTQVLINIFIEFPSIFYKARNKWCSFFFRPPRVFRGYRRLPGAASSSRFPTLRRRSWMGTFCGERA
jgi:hypothetical protein